MLPALVLLAVFFFVPFFDTILLSFKDFSSDIYNPSWVGLDNYMKLFASAEFFEVIKNTFIFLFAVVPVLVVIPLIAAIFVNQKIRGLTLYKVLIYLPVVVSIVVFTKTLILF